MNDEINLMAGTCDDPFVIVNNSGKKITNKKDLIQKAKLVSVMK